MTNVPHPAYSTDLALWNFYVSRTMKLRMKGRRFVSTEEIRAESQQVLNTLSRKISMSASKNGKIAGNFVY
jgi:hypothetical protein